MPVSVFDGTADLGRATLICSWIFTVLAVLSLCCIIALSVLKRSCLSAGDGVIYASFIVGLVLVAQTTWAVIHEGRGLHVDQLDKSTAEKIAKSLFANESLWSVVNTLLRIAAILFVQQVFGLHEKTRVISSCVLVAVIGHGVANFLTALLICRPIAASWDNAVAGQCGDQKRAYLISEVLGCLLDLLITAIPIAVIPRLHMPRHERAKIMFIFSLGSVVIIVTGLRIQAMSLVNSTDISYNDSYIGLLSVIGGLLGIIVSGATLIPAMIAQFKPKPLRPPPQLTRVDGILDPPGTFDEESLESAGEDKAATCGCENKSFPPDSANCCTGDSIDDMVEEKQKAMEIFLLSSPKKSFTV